MFQKRFRTVTNLIVIVLLLTTTIGMSTIADIDKGTPNDLDDNPVDSTPVSGAINGIDDDELDYDENTTEYESIGDATQYGIPYVIWYDWPVGSPPYYEDAEKTLLDDGEGNPGIHWPGDPGLAGGDLSPLPLEKLDGLPGFWQAPTDREKRPGKRFG